MRGGGLTVVATETGDTGTSDGGNHPGRGDAAYTMSVALGDIDFTRCADGNRNRKIQLRTGGLPIVSGRTRHTGARDGGYHPGWGHLAHAVVEALRDV